MKISICFPTRNRPDNLRRIHKSLQETSTVMPEIAVYVDDDDSTSVPVAQELGFVYEQGPRFSHLSRCFNKAAELASGDILMFGGDDLVFRTKGWDDQVLAEFNKYDDRIVFVHCRDDYREDDLGCHGFLHRNWIEATGYFVPPYFETWYIDNWITDVSKAIGRRSYLQSLLIEHMHFTCGKAEMDATYGDQEKHYNQAGIVWQQTASKRIEDIEKLQKYVAERSGGFTSRQS